MTATLMTRPDVHAVPRPASRVPLIAAWLFVLPLLTEGVLPDVVKLEVAGLGVLAFTLIGSGRVLPRRAVERIFAVLAVLMLTVCAYLAFRHWPSGAGSARSYDTHAALWVVTYTVVAVFAVLFFREDLFARVIWRGAVIALWIGVASCAASRLTGHLLLANPNYGATRMVGTLTEPAEWAPLLTVILLLAIRRRSRLYVALALAGLLLADSPTCMLVMAVTVPLYIALASSWRYRIPLLAALLVIIPAGVIFVQHADAPAWMSSGNTAEVAVGRLVSGIQNVGTDGRQGSNARFENTAGALAAVRENGWMHFGAGPDADATYFPAMRAAGGPVAGVNALWADVLVNFGEGGLAILAVLMITAAWRMRRRPEMCAILLPFFVASLVNSAIPDWSLVALGIMLYVFGWVPGPHATRRIVA
jgi:hypothetical protein